MDGVILSDFFYLMLKSVARYALAAIKIPGGLPKKSLCTVIIIYIYIICQYVAMNLNTVAGSRQLKDVWETLR